MPSIAKAKKPGGPCVALSKDLGEGRRGVCGATESTKWRFNGSGEWAGQPWCGGRQCGFAVGARDEEKERTAAKEKKETAKAEQQAADEAAAAERAAARAQQHARAPPQPRSPAAAAAPAAAQPAARPATAPPARPAARIPACQRLWEDLRPADRAAARSLGFEQWRWDASVNALHQDIVAPDNEYKLAGWSLLQFHEIVGVRHCSTLEMSGAQREVKLPENLVEPCFLVRGRFQSAYDSPTNEESP